MTFLLGLVAGLIIGWVVEWIIDWQFWRSEADETFENQRQLREELEQAQDEIADLKAQLAQPDVGDPDHIQPDDLEEIDGIGPAFAASLSAAGIDSFAELAAATPEDLRAAIGAEAWQSTDTESWVAEAQRRINQPSKGE